MDAEPIDTYAVGTLIESAAPVYDRLAVNRPAIIEAQQRLIECLDNDRDYWRKQALGEQWSAAAWGFGVGAALVGAIAWAWRAF